MTFKNKALVGIMLFLLLIVIVISGAIFAVFKVKDSEAQLNENFAHQVVLAERARGFLEEQFSIVPSFVLNPQLPELKRFEKAHLELAHALSDLRAELTLPEEITLVREMADIDLNEYKLAEPGLRMRLQGKTISEVNRYFENKTFQQTLLLRNDMDEMVNLKVSQLEQARHLLRTSFTKLTSVIFVSAIVGISLCFLIGGLVWRSVCQNAREQELQKELMAHQEQLSLARKEVVEVVAHDLKSPLATLLMNLEMTQDDLIDKKVRYDDLLETVAMGIRSAKNMKNLIDSLLDHSKIESEHLDLNLKNQSVVKLLEEQVSQLNVLASPKSIEVTVHIPSPLPALSFDEMRIRQVISNLISNAIKFVNANGRIDVSACVVKNEMQISVLNSGSYLNEEEIKHVFDRYWQVRKTAREGTGLGLAIVKGIMQAHNGEVEVTSDRVNGTQFTLRFPLPSPVPPSPSSYSDSTVFKSRTFNYS